MLVLLVEDDPSLQESLARVLLRAGHSHHCFDSAEGLLSFLNQRSLCKPTYTPTCILMDVNLGITNGIDAQKVIRQFDDAIPIVFMSGIQDAKVVNEAWRDGASNFLFKPFSPQELLSCLELAIKAQTNVSLSKSTLSLSHATTPTTFISLTARQKSVLKLVAQGHTNAQSASLLGVSPRTIKMHRAALMQRLNCQHMADLVRYYESVKHLFDS